VLDVLLLVPYYGGSHRAWAQGYAAHSAHRVHLVSLPARFWKWRMQGGALTLAEEAEALGTQPDVILATDMVNLPAFLGLMRQRLASVPVALYCHENQLTYPLQEGEKRDLTYGMINWLSMVAADRVFFNSRFHVEDWFDELPRLLSHFPDCSHGHRIAGVRQRSQVLPVGCDLKRLDAGEGASRSLDEPPLVLWNQRWEYDKNPREFLSALDVLAADGVPFRVALAGKSCRQTAAEFEAAQQRLGARVVHFGFASATAYRRLLRTADIVVSTANHEFFGVAVVEAIYGGCWPLLPTRLSYPEIIPESLHADHLYEGFDELVGRLRSLLAAPGPARRPDPALRAAVARYDWRQLATVYDRRLGELVS
jgi:glycosyltransferase involved in cell wall biosynthesis